MQCIIRPSLIPFSPFPYRSGIFFLKWASIWWDSRGLDKASIGDKRRSERLSLLHKQFCSVQTEGREHPTHIRTNAVIRTKGSHHRFQSAHLGNPPGKLNGKAKRKVIREGAFPGTAPIDTRTVQSAQSKLTGFPDSPQERVRWNWERRTSFSIRLTISIRNNRSNTSPTEWFSPTFACRGPFYSTVSTTDQDLTKK